MSNAVNSKILLVAWDSAGWDVVNPLLDGNELPHLAGLVQRGVIGTMNSPKPLMEPAIYTSLATGKHPDRHGVYGTHEVYDHGRAARPVTRLSRQAKTFWEILSQQDIPCNVVGFPSVDVAEPVNGVFVGRNFFISPPANYWDPFEIPDDSVYPPDQRATLQEYTVTLQDIDAQTMYLFAPHMNELAGDDPYLLRIGASVARTLTVHTVSTWLMENTDWQVMSVSYPAIEQLSRYFLKYRAPKLDWVDQVEFDHFNDVVSSSVRLCDLLLGRLLYLAGDDATVIVYSPRAYIPHTQAPRGAVPMGPRAEASQHRPQGIFAMQGAGVRADALVHGVRVVDVCPTILRLCDLAVPKDMDGRTLADAYDQPLGGHKSIDTWDSVPPAIPELPEDMQPVPWQELFCFNSPYGYRAAANIQIEHDWQMAEMLTNTARPCLAVPLITRLYYSNPLRTAMAPTIAEVLYLLGLVDEAIAIIRSYVALFRDTPNGKFFAGVIAPQEGRDFEALDLFESAAEADLPTPNVYFHLGEIYRRSHRIDRALGSYDRSVEVDPHFLLGYIGAAQAHTQTGNYEAAIDTILKGLSVDFSHAPSHYFLGTYLEKFGDLDGAKGAYQNALTFKADFQPAQDRLDVLLSGQERPEAEGDQSDQAEQDTAVVASGMSRWEVDDLRLIVQSARQEIMAWANHFIQSFQEADLRMDDYLLENAQLISERTDEPVTILSGTGPALADTGFIIRPAMPADLSQFRPLAARAISERDQYELFVFHRANQERLHGVMALRIVEATGKKLNLLVQLLTGEGEDETGLSDNAVARLLVRAGIARAAASGADQIDYTVATGQNDIMPVLQDLGFAVTKRELVMVLDMIRTRDRCLRVVDWFRRRGAIGDDVRCLPLRDVPTYRVDRFFRGYFTDGIGPKRMELDGEICRVVLKGDDIVAAFSGYQEGETFIAPRIAVADGHRGGWATPMCIGEGAAAGAQAGLTGIGMYADQEAFPDMVRMARRLDAEELNSRCTLRLPLAATWPELTSSDT